ncbi:hypothetical protein M3Y99_00529100 [Aphelenchoides fujianensis]|nr:hypothetical protein M3Y99_00529100 [Aphelenchoides fujianensis]
MRLLVFLLLSALATAFAPLDGGRRTLRLSIEIERVGERPAGASNVCRAGCFHPPTFAVRLPADRSASSREWSLDVEKQTAALSAEFALPPVDANGTLSLEFRLQSTHPRYGFTEACWTEAVLLPLDQLVNSREHEQTIDDPCIQLRFGARLLADEPPERTAGSLVGGSPSSAPFTIVVLSVGLLLLVLLGVLGFLLRTERRKTRALHALIKYDFERRAATPSSFLAFSPPAERKRRDSTRYENVPEIAA